MAPIRITKTNRESRESRGCALKAWSLLLAELVTYTVLFAFIFGFSRIVKSNLKPTELGFAISQDFLKNYMPLLLIVCLVVWSASRYWVWTIITGKRQPFLPVFFRGIGITAVSWMILLWFGSLALKLMKPVILLSPVWLSKLLILLITALVIAPIIFHILCLQGMIFYHNIAYGNPYLFLTKQKGSNRRKGFRIVAWEQMIFTMSFVFVLLTALLQPAILLPDYGRYILSFIVYLAFVVWSKIYLAKILEK